MSLKNKKEKIIETINDNINQKKKKVGWFRKRKIWKEKRNNIKRELEIKVISEIKAKLEGQE